MKPILVISHNTRSAGTLNISLRLIEHLKDQKIPVFITLPYDFPCQIYSNEYIRYSRCLNHLPIIGLLFRFIYDMVFIPYIIIKHKPKLIIGIANYFINFSNIPSRLIIRHQYLLDKENRKMLKNHEQIIEYFRNIYFRKSIKTASHIFLQTNYMYELFNNQYPELKNKSSILPNPISYNLTKVNTKKVPDLEKIFIYPSRYYPHKNHDFLIELVKSHSDFFLENKIKFFITINKNQSSAQFILKNIKQYQLSSLIENIGEVAQDELFEIYRKCFAIFFPSQAESFGNGLIEGILFNMPVVVPNLSYATSLLKDAGVFYENNNLNSAFHEIQKLVNDELFYSDIVQKTAKKIDDLIGVEQWWNQLIE